MSPAGAPDPGFDAEILAGFARLHGLTAERLSVASWDALAASLLKGQGDLVAGGYTGTAARRETIDFTIEVFPTRHVVITRRPRPAVTTLAQLRTLRVSTVKGISMADALAAVGVEQVDESIPPRRRALGPPRGQGHRGRGRARIGAGGGTARSGAAGRDVRRELRVAGLRGTEILSPVAGRAQRVPGQSPPQPDVESAGGEILRRLRPRYPPPGPGGAVSDSRRRAGTRSRPPGPSTSPTPSACGTARADPPRAEWRRGTGRRASKAERRPPGERPR